MPLDPAQIRFTCLPGCTNCCDQSGYVYLSEADLIRAAAFLQLSPADFEARYIYRTRHLIRLRKPPRSQCHFLEGHGCAIHPAKPTQCRTFPFWPDLIQNETYWRDAANYCPGIGVGDFVPLADVQQALAEMTEADSLG
jgi:Fe-S-cluster containining protein